MTCNCNNHVSFYRGHRITIQQTGRCQRSGPPFLRFGWFFDVSGTHLVGDGDMPYSDDFEAHLAATREIDAAIARVG